jgi:hypothetical protein
MAKEYDLKRIIILVGISILLSGVFCIIFNMLYDKGILINGNGYYFGNDYIFGSLFVTVIWSHFVNGMKIRPAKRYLKLDLIYMLCVTAAAVIILFATMLCSTASWQGIPALLGTAALNLLFLALAFTLDKYLSSRAITLLQLFLWLSAVIEIGFEPDIILKDYYDYFGLFRGYNDMFLMESYLWLAKILVIAVLVLIIGATCGKYNSARDRE